MPRSHVNKQTASIPISDIWKLLVEMSCRIGCRMFRFLYTKIILSLCFLLMFMFNCRLVSCCGLPSSNSSPKPCRSWSFYAWSFPTASMRKIFLGEWRFRHTSPCTLTGKGKRGCISLAPKSQWNEIISSFIQKKGKIRKSLGGIVLVFSAKCFVTWKVNDKNISYLRLQCW